MTRNWDVAAAGVVGLLSVGLGAFAAHGMSDAKAIEWLKTASQYAAVHALAVLAVAGLARSGFAVVRGTSAAFLIGVLVFSGSLVAMAFGAPRWFGAITPIGGVAFMVGWGLVALGRCGGHKPPLPARPDGSRAPPALPAVARALPLRWRQRVGPDFRRGGRRN